MPNSVLCMGQWSPGKVSFNKPCSPIFFNTCLTLQSHGLESPHPVSNSDPPSGLSGSFFSILSAWVVGAVVVEVFLLICRNETDPPHAAILGRT